MSLIQRYPHCWNGGLVPVYTKVSSFQGIGIEEFHCIQRCPYFRGLEYMCTELSLLQGAGIDVYRGVLTSGGWNRCVQRCPYFRGLE